jgi:hypothetical protein
MLRKIRPSQACETRDLRILAPSTRYARILQLLWRVTLVNTPITASSDPTDVYVVVCISTSVTLAWKLKFDGGGMLLIF